MEYENAFEDLKNWNNSDDTMKDSEVTWMEMCNEDDQDVLKTTARSIVNRFYHEMVNHPSIKSHECFRARNTNPKSPVNFSCSLRKFRCAGFTKNNNQCSRHIAAGLPMCFQHSIRNFGVKLARTTLLDVDNNRLKMIGIIACRRNIQNGQVAFKRNDVICPYIGEIFVSSETDARFHKEACAPYTITIGRVNRRRRQEVDSSCVRGIGSYVNSALFRSSASDAEREILNKLGNDNFSSRRIKNNNIVSATANCRLVVLVTDVVGRVGRNPQPWIVATKNIRNNEELFIPLIGYNGCNQDDKHATFGQNYKRSGC